MGARHSHEEALVTSTLQTSDVEAPAEKTRVRSTQGQTDDDLERIRGLTRLLTAETQRQKEEKEHDEDTVNHKDNMNILKQLFKKMDPSILKTSTFSDHGDIQLSFKYDAPRELLIVKVISCNDLDPKDLRGKSADPYVKLWLHTESGRIGSEHVTQTIKRNLNPVYNELFTFPVTEDVLRDGLLVIQVWDYDLMDKDDLIGETIVQLGNIDFFLQPIHTGWYTLKAETNLCIGGDLEVTLTFTMPAKLFVTVHRGNNLTNFYTEGKPNPMVKLQVPGVQTIHSTKVQYDTVNPVWEETFEFQVRQEELGFRYVVLHAIDYDDGGDNESLGQIIIELDHLDISQGYHGSFELADLRNSERLRAKWFQGATVQEFREALVSHAAFRQPKFLFNRHTGVKVVSVVSKRAKAEAKLRIVNGIPVY